MAEISKHPDLPDYFETRQAGENVVASYEAGKVITMDLGAAIDFDFWASLDTAADPLMKKFRVNGEEARPSKVSPLGERVSEEVRRLYEAVLPTYYAAFGGYDFTRKFAVCRLTQQRSTPMHFDSYDEQNPHFARMFVNLDTQPRIWWTGHHVEQIFEREADFIAQSGDLSSVELWKALRERVYGRGDHGWWLGPPERHVCHFDPGDAWIVDSRQVAHGVVHGRRCISIDFYVDQKSMADPSRYYLELLGKVRP